MSRRRGNLTYDLAMRFTSFTRGLVLSFLVACGGGDGSTGDCVDLCTEAQAGQCTSIAGNCTSFCEALDGVQGPSNCTSQRNAYQGCLDTGDNVCANDCDAQEMSLSNCVTAYCATHQTDADCVTLAASF